MKTLDKSTEDKSAAEKKHFFVCHAVWCSYSSPSSFFCVFLWILKWQTNKYLSNQLCLALSCLIYCQLRINVPHAWIKNDYSSLFAWIECCMKKRFWLINFVSARFVQSTEPVTLSSAEWREYLLSNTADQFSVRYTHHYTEYDAQINHSGHGFQLRVTKSIIEETINLIWEQTKEKARHNNTYSIWIVNINGSKNHFKLLVELKPKGRITEAEPTSCGICFWSGPQ